MPTIPTTYHYNLLVTPTPYQLGIIWSIGSYIASEQKFVFRHKNKYFLNQIQPLTNHQIYSQTVKDETQYVLKTPALNIQYLKKQNWATRNSDIRNIPILSIYKDFLRAYLEIHSGLDYCTSYSNKKAYKYKYYRLRLRIYGNKSLINALNIIINQEIKIPIKTPQSTHNNKTTILYYTALDDLHKIFNYTYDTPCHKEYWNQVNYCLANPRKHT